MTTRTILAIFVVVFTYSLSIAAEHKMTCENPRQGYVAVFDDVAKTFQVSAPGQDVTYSVKRIDQSGRDLIISGSTMEGGPEFMAHIGTQKRIDFLEDKKVIQTDQCK